MNRCGENETTATSLNSPHERRNKPPNPEVAQPVERPYGDADNLYEIPRVRADDPPMRHWWMDD